MKCGQRVIQTNDPRYKVELSLTVESIKRNIDDNQEKYFNILKLRHELNLKYERKNGFDYEINKKKQTKDKAKKVIKRKEPKQTTIPLNIDLSKLNFILN